MKTSSIEAPRRRSGRVTKVPDWTPEAWPETQKQDEANVVSVLNELPIDISNESVDKDVADTLLSASRSKDLQGFDNTKEATEVLDTSPKLTRFKDLPKEVRFMIWKFAIPKRIINLIVKRFGEKYRRGKWGYNWQGRKERDPDNIWFQYNVVSNQSDLPTLAVNQESRELTLKAKKEYLQYLSSGQKIYFNPKEDTIFIDTYSLWNLGHMIKWGRTVQDCQRFLHGFEKVEALATERHHGVCIHAFRSPTPLIRPNNPPLLPNLRLWIYGMPKENGSLTRWRNVVLDFKAYLDTQGWLRTQGGVRAVEDLEKYFSWVLKKYPKNEREPLPQLMKKKFRKCGKFQLGYLVRRGQQGR